jgi:hypothetical protein
MHTNFRERKMKYNLSFIAVVSVLGSGLSYAKETTGPGVIKTESGIDIIPQLSTQLKYDDNLARTAQNKESSTIFEVSPSASAILVDGTNRYNADFSLNSGTYFSSSDDNFLDFNLSGNADVELNQNHSYNLNTAFVSGHEGRGTGLSEGAGNTNKDLTEFQTLTLGGHYEYGADSTPARIKLSVKSYDMEYTNFEAVSKFRNFNTATFNSTFFYDTGAFTSLVAELESEVTDYEHINPSDAQGTRDSSVMNYRIGVEWQATALTSGSLRIGYQDKDFDSNSRKDFGGLAWSASVQYQPYSYSTISLTTGRLARDPNVEGDYVRDTNYGLNWNHNWNDFVSSEVGITHKTEDYTGVNRKDTTKSYRVAVNYDVLSWVSATAGIDFQDKSSTNANINFDKLVTFIGFNFTL